MIKNISLYLLVLSLLFPLPFVQGSSSEENVWDSPDSLSHPSSTLEEQAISEFREKVACNLETLAKKFDKCKINEDADQGAGFTAERVLIGLTSLLMEQTTCAAAFISQEGPGKRSLWIGCNKHNDDPVRSIMKSIQTLLQAKNGPGEGRDELVQNKDIKNILSLSVNQGRSPGQYRSQIVTSADEMIHWIKKILSLRGKEKEQTALGTIARCLRDNRIEYFSTEEGHHAEMNIINALHEKGHFKKGGFIAICKQCCLKCAAALQAVNNTSKGGIYSANGCHFKVYEWPIPNFLEGNEVVLKEFIGEDAFEVYKIHPQHKEKFLSLVKNLTQSDMTIKTRKRTAVLSTETESPSYLALTTSENPDIKIKKGSQTASIKVKKKEKETKVTKLKS